MLSLLVLPYCHVKISTFTFSIYLQPAFFFFFSVIIIVLAFSTQQSGKVSVTNFFSSENK